MGGRGKRYWFLDGKPFGETLSGDSPQLIPESGRHQIAVLDASGNVDRIEIVMEDRS